MAVVMLSALLGAPSANLGAQLAIVKGVGTLANHGADALLADVNAFNATFGAIVHALVARHFVEALVASKSTGLAGIDTGLERFHHGSFSILEADPAWVPLVKWCLRFARSRSSTMTLGSV